ncbi:MAG: GatB/YqeY domain-containing protein, partial [Myxococcota bacterium]
MADAETFLQLQADMKDAMRAKDKERLTTVRLLIASLKNKQIELRRELTEGDILSVLATEAKKRRESAAAYRDGGR